MSQKVSWGNWVENLLFSHISIYFYPSFPNIGFHDNAPYLSTIDLHPNQAGMTTLPTFPKKLPLLILLLLFHPLCAQEFVVINGGKASATSFMAKLKAPNKKKPSIQAHNFISSNGLSIHKKYKSVPGLMSLRPTINIRNNNKKNPKVTSEQLIRLIKKMRQSGHFEYVEPDWIVSIKQTPIDSSYTDGSLWGLKNTGQSSGEAGVDINAEPAWAINFGSPDIVVGVVDTGIRYTHQDLVGNMWINPDEIPGNNIDDDNNGYIDDIHGINAINNDGDPMDDNDHGSHCAGTIAATANDSGRIVGVAYGVKLMALKFLSAAGSGATSDAVECIDYAISEGVDVLSNSWGGGGSSATMLNIISAANDAGILFIAAAGNESSNTDSSANFPSNYEVENVISVAAIDRNGNLANFSNYGQTTVDIGAPGVDILSSTSGSDTEYSSFSGTSMATPHVAGVAALVLSQFPSASVIEQKNRILSTAATLSSLTGKTLTGGRVDAHGALTVTADGTLEISVSSNPYPLIEGETASVFIKVTDLLPQTDATVNGSLNGGNTISFLDDGTAPDLSSGDGIYSASVSIPPSVSSVSLAVNASKNDKIPFSGNFTLNVVTPPPNDDFVNRLILTSATSQATGTNELATIETDEKTNPSDAGQHTVWWQYTAPFSSDLTISTLGSNYDTTLAVYTGTPALSGMTLVGANDDDSGVTSSVTFTAIFGNDYYIQVSGYLSDTGNIVLNYPDPGAASGSPLITTHPKSQNLLLNEALSLTVSAVSSHDLTFQWHKDSAPIPGATDPDYDVASVTLNDAGTYYVIVTDANLLSTTSQTATVSINSTAIRPVNDLFADAEIVNGNYGRVTGVNVLATKETGEPEHDIGADGITSIWYTWTPSADVTIRFNTIGSDFDTILAAYTGTALNDLTKIDSDDDSVGLQSQIEFSALAGVAYYIAVDGYSGAEGQVVLNWATYIPTTPGPNDNFVDALELIGSSDMSNLYNSDSATGETGEPNHAGAGELDSAQNSLWWKWTAPSSGSATISTSGSSFDTVLAAYSGADVNDLTEIASNDDFSGFLSEITFATLAGRTYYFAVDGFAANTGDVSIIMNYVPSGFSAWISYFFAGADAAPLADPEGDGVQNLVTYALGLTPGTFGLDSFGTNRLPVYNPLNASTGGISFTLPATPPSDITCRIKESRDLLSWSTIATKTGASPWVFEPGITSSEELTPSGAIKTTIGNSSTFATTPASFLRLEIEN
jgi:subtilisin family serine protease